MRTAYSLLPLARRSFPDQCDPFKATRKDPLHFRSWRSGISRDTTRFCVLELGHPCKAVFSTEYRSQVHCTQYWGSNSRDIISVVYQRWRGYRAEVVKQRIQRSRAESPDSQPRILIVNSSAIW